MSQHFLLVNASATGSESYWPGGFGTFHVVGTFGEASVRLERLGPDGMTWTPVPMTTMSEPGMARFCLGAGHLRAAVSGGNPSGLYAVASGMDEMRTPR